MYILVCFEAGMITDTMIDKLANLLFRCWHRRLSRPMAAVRRPGEPDDNGYVVCLDCGLKFSYDLKKMAIGKPLKGPTPN